MHLFDVAREIARRLAAIFVRGPDGRRPVFGGARLFQEDPSWRDHLLFYEYFHGDNGAGIGASHQTGWTGLIATLMDFFGTVSADIFLKAGLGATVAEGVGAEPAPSGGERIVVRRAEERKREAQEA